MLSAVFGGEVIQDVPACFAGNILDDNYCSVSFIFIVIWQRKVPACLAGTLMIYCIAMSFYFFSSFAVRRSSRSLRYFSMSG